MRSKGARVGYANSVKGADYTREKKWNRELDRYANAVAQGIQPEGTTTRKIEAAERWSEHYGEAYSETAALNKVKTTLVEEHGQ